MMMLRVPALVSFLGVSSVALAAQTCVSVGKVATDAYDDCWTNTSSVPVIVVATPSSSNVVKEMSGKLCYGGGTPGTVLSCTIPPGSSYAIEYISFSDPVDFSGNLTVQPSGSLSASLNYGSDQVVGPVILLKSTQGGLATNDPNPGDLTISGPIPMVSVEPIQYQVAIGYVYRCSGDNSSCSPPSGNQFSPYDYSTVTAPYGCAGGVYTIQIVVSGQQPWQFQASSDSPNYLSPSYSIPNGTLSPGTYTLVINDPWCHIFTFNFTLGT